MRHRLGTSTSPADRLSASYPDHVWALDYQFAVTTNGRIIKMLHVTNEFTRQSLSDLAGSDLVVGVARRQPGLDASPSSFLSRSWATRAAGGS
jgi:hypothetical protein